jgi:hypothetical protein
MVGTRDRIGSPAQSAESATDPTFGFLLEEITLLGEFRWQGYCFRRRLTLQPAIDLGVEESVISLTDANGEWDDEMLPSIWGVLIALVSGPNYSTTFLNSCRIQTGRFSFFQTTACAPTRFVSSGMRRRKS